MNRWKEMEDLIGSELKKLSDALGKIFKSPDKPDPILSMHRATRGNTYSNKYTWERSYQQVGVPLSEQQKHFIHLGKAVYTYCHDNQRKIWVTQPNEKSDHLATKLGILGPQYNYNLMRVLRKLPLDDKDLTILQRMKDQLYNGESVPATFITNGKFVPVRIAADPLNRSVKIFDPQLNQLPLESFGVKLTTPVEVDHYAIYQDGKKSGVLPYFISAADFISKKMEHFAEQNIETRMSLYAMYEPPKQSHDREVLMSSKYCTQVLSAEVICDNIGDHSLHIKEHAKPADMHTPEEKALRELLAKKPHMLTKEILSLEKTQRLKPKPTLDKPDAKQSKQQKPGL